MSATAPSTDDLAGREVVRIARAANMLNCSTATIRRKAPIVRTCAGPRVPMSWLRSQLNADSGEPVPTTPSIDPRLDRKVDSILGGLRR